MLIKIILKLIVKKRLQVTFFPSNQNEVNEVASIKTPSDLFSQQMPAISITRNGISKRHLHKTLSIPSIAFEQALNLYVELQFDH
ncbi:17729_t:CDS:2 [Cetraspora pellucida]|uniref:17729_t:CDS:1 n=1 Tax=Cetraspora pellucida TaxID=1433469 RepID=A0A9N9FMD6_9GLOM|nr:17729_t:CDS:2 [Cetraspora pellucida]